MKILDLVKSAKESNEKAFGNVADVRAAAIVRAALEEILKSVESLEEDSLFLAGFGKFVVKKVRVIKDGEETVERRLLFRAVRRNKPPE